MPLDEDVARLAKGKNLATVVTLMPSGQPQALLTWVDADDEHVLVNTEPQRQRARNVVRDPRITVLIHSGEPYDWAEVRGHVVETVGGDEARQHIDELSRKYTGPRLCRAGRPAGPGDPQGRPGQGQHPARSLGLLSSQRRFFRHVERVADRPPDDLGVHAVREGALDRAPTEVDEHEVLGHALRVDVTELRPHPVPEFRQPHPARVLPRGPGPARRQGPDRCRPRPGRRDPGRHFYPMCRY